MNSSNSSPKEIINSFRMIYKNKKNCVDTLKKISEKPQDEKSTFIDPAIKFIIEEQEDNVRSWVTNILELAGGEKSFNTLVDILEREKSFELKRKFLYTRFFSLRAIRNLSKSEEQKAKLKELIERISKDPDEDYLLQAEALVILSEQGDENSKMKVEEWLKADDFWRPLRALRAVYEVPLPDFVDELLSIIAHCNNTDHRYWAIKALSKYPEDSKVVRELGEISVEEPTSYLRLEAVKSLGRLKNRKAIIDLLNTLRDSDAEIRFQASRAIENTLSKDEAVSCIVDEALKKETNEEERKLFAESLRHIDPERKISTEILSKNLNAENRDRAQAAREILVNLGGWTAIQRVSQRRITLGDLDRLLTESEKIVKDTFEDTIRQARRNFYFAMGVNVLIVIIGIALILIAIHQVIRDPNTLYAWVIPGASGFFGVIITMNFNNPRRNAREDLTTLMNVNIIFLGFLRQLNEIDATFKHAYLEKQDFGKQDMELAVEKIGFAMEQTLNMASRHLSDLQSFADNFHSSPTDPENQPEK